MLRPFLRVPWASDTHGHLVFEGDPSTGQLQVLHGAGDGGAAAEARAVRVDARGVELQAARTLKPWEDGDLEPGPKPLRLHKDKSHFKRLVVWVDGTSSEVETWRVQALPEQAGLAQEGTSLSSTAPPQPRSIAEVVAFGNAEVVAGRFAQAVRWFTAALEAVGPGASPLRLETLLSRLKANASAGEPRAALADAEEVLALDPESFSSHAGLGLARYVNGDYLNASASWREALRRDPQNRECWEGLQRSLSMHLAGWLLPDLRRTFDVRSYGSEPREVWGSFLPIGAPPGAPLRARQFAMSFKSAMYPPSQLPYVLTLPGAAGAVGGKFPLLLYLHTAGSAEICSGDVALRQLQYVVQEAPLPVFVERGQQTPADGFIGLTPCCPSNLGQLLHDVPRAYKKWKVHWFKSCEGAAYAKWDFSQALRCHALEVSVSELLLQVCEQLPVDPTRIYFVGASCGGYAVLRLGEVLPGLPAAIVPMAGYYPDIPGQDHDTTTMVDRLKGVTVWPMHCEQDKLCRLDYPSVSQMYRLFSERNGVQVDWVPGKVARGSHSNFHSASNCVFSDPNRFFSQLSRFERRLMQDAPAYLRQRLRELQPPLFPRADGPTAVWT